MLGKTPVLESLFNFLAADLKCFPLNFSKFLRALVKEHPIETTSEVNIRNNSVFQNNTDQGIPEFLTFSPLTQYDQTYFAFISLSSSYVSSKLVFRQTI